MKCIVCQERETGGILCHPCLRSFKQAPDTSNAGTIAWAAKRARRFERRRQEVREAETAAGVALVASLREKRSTVPRL